MNIPGPRTAAVLAIALSAALPVARADVADHWAQPMRRVHARFDGKRGTIAHFGDSITVTLAYWTPLLYKRDQAPTELADAFERVKGYQAAECWREWKGPQFGSQGSMTVRWAQQNVDAWLKKLDPEVALIMFGTNDLHAMNVQQHKAGLAEVVGKCLDNGTVVILSTIPPRHGFDEKCRQFVEAQRQVATELKVPLIDFYAEVLKRRPNDWDGALEKFREHQGYDVPTLIARDGVHPSHPKAFADDYSERGLSNCGFALRNYLSLMKYDEVIGQVLRAPPDPGPGPTTAPDQPGARADRPTGPPVQDWFAKALPLPAPAGQVIRVATVEQLFDAVRDIQPGGTILIADGRYMLPRSLRIATDRVTLRGAGGNRDAAILDCARSAHHEGIAITACSDVTIADLTLTNVRQNGFKLNSDSGVHRVTLYNCVGHNIWQRHVKGVPGKMVEGKRVPSSGCRIQYCLFYNDRAKRLDDEPYERANPDQFGGNYVGGIDAMNTKDWVISDNVFTGLRGRTGGARGAIFLWNGSAGATIERNILIDCDTGICLGNSHRAGEWDGVPHCAGFLVRNNFVTRCPESNILAAWTSDCRIVHNTVHDPAARFGRLLRVVHDNAGLVATNNVFSGPRIVVETDPATIRTDGNLVRAVPGYFVDPARGDLHLTAAAADAIDRANPGPDAPEDIDRQKRTARPDLGADERAP